MAHVNDLYAVLASKGIEILEAEELPNKLRLIGRLHKNFGDQWKLVMHRLLVAEAGSTWKVDISKKYFLKSNKVFYGWRLIFQAESLSQHYDAIAKVIKSTPMPSRVIINEVPLVGTSSKRDQRVASTREIDSPLGVRFRG